MDDLLNPTHLRCSKSLVAYHIQLLFTEFKVKSRAVQKYKKLTSTALLTTISTISKKVYFMKYKSLTQKAITARFSITEYQRIEEVAEASGSNLAEVLREAWRSYKKKDDFSSDLQKLRIELLKQTFEICSAVAGLNEHERTEAITELKKRLGELS